MNNGTVTVQVWYDGPYGGDVETIQVEVKRQFVGPSHIPEVAEEAVKRALAAASAE